MRIQELVEALKPSQYRKYVQGWDKSKYNDIFGGKYRIELPTPEDNTSAEPDPYVEKAIKAAGYEISDYKAGLAKKDNRQIRIGKILTDPNIIKRFTNDPARAGSNLSNKSKIIISRHPYDVAGMSTDRGWTSCMNLETGSNKKYIAADVKEGTIIAYLVGPGDNDIRKPIARVLIKPFINKNSGDVALGVSNKVYGNPPPWFAQTVINWADKINSSRKLAGIFVVPSNLYNDDDEIVKMVGDIDPQEIAEEIQLSNINKITNMIHEGYVTTEVLLRCANFSIHKIADIADAVGASDDKDLLNEQVQIAWCNRSDNNASEVISKFLDNNWSIEISEKAILIAISHDHNTLRELRRSSYRLTEEMVKLGKESLLKYYYSDDMGIGELCDLIDGFYGAKLQIPKDVLNEIADQGEAAVYYGNTYKKRFEAGEHAMSRDLRPNKHEEISQLGRYAVMIYALDRSQPEEILNTLKQSDLLWHEYTHKASQYDKQDKRRADLDLKY